MSANNPYQPLVALPLNKLLQRAEQAVLEISQTRACEIFKTERN